MTRQEWLRTRERVRKVVDPMPMADAALDPRDDSLQDMLAHQIQHMRAEMRAAAEDQSDDDFIDDALLGVADEVRSPHEEDDPYVEYAFERALDSFVPELSTDSREPSEAEDVGGQVGVERNTEEASTAPSEQYTT